MKDEFIVGYINYHENHVAYYDSLTASIIINTYVYTVTIFIF